MIDVYEEAKKKYPKPWNKAMLKRLVNLGKLTRGSVRGHCGRTVSRLSWKTG